MEDTNLKENGLLTEKHKYFKDTKVEVLQLTT
jgi:hypothetical protein